MEAEIQYQRMVAAIRTATLSLLPSEQSCPVSHSEIREAVRKRTGLAVEYAEIRHALDRMSPRLRRLHYPEVGFVWAHDKYCESSLVRR